MKAARTPHRSSTRKRKERDSKKRAEGNPEFAAIFMFKAAVCVCSFLNILREQKRGLGKTVRSLHCVL